MIVISLFFNFDGDRISRKITQVAWSWVMLIKEIFTLYLKEIHEQHQTIVKSMDQDKKNLEKFCKIITDAKMSLLLEVEPVIIQH